MPRRLIRKFLPHPDTLHRRWYFRIFGSRIRDSRLWAVNRRSITAAFGTGLAICFLPLPLHLPLALLVAILLRLNVPVIMGTTLLVNPLTAVPIYYTAYRVGTFALGQSPGRFAFELSWDWLQNGLGPFWKPFLTGCMICALIVGYGGYLTFELIWRWRTLSRLRMKRDAARR
ncbi:MAG TPA: DUF2062 domain-containing protein [Steroidobacteraceae bacterium]|jgi:uncharacterized protein (DUF2062 family)|nr:DUF2062 domain-containing protein [Steroidobacteraceae bacterium]